MANLLDYVPFNAREIERATLESGVPPALVYAVITKEAPPGKPGAMVYGNDAKRCNQCGSDDLRRDGSHRAVVLDYARYVCGSCGAHIRAGWVNRAAVTRGIG